MTTRKSITNNGIVIFKDQLSTISLLPNEIIGAGLKLLLSNFDAMEHQENIFYELIASNVRRYREQADISSKFGKLGGNPTLKGRDKGGDKGTLKQQEKKIQEKNNNKEMYKESFDRFWSIYPKQRAGSKEKAFASFCKAIKEERATEEQIIHSAELYAKSDEVKRGFAKGCSAWLNDDRFNNTYTNERGEYNDGYGRC